MARAVASPLLLLCAAARAFELPPPESVFPRTRAAPVAGLPRQTPNATNGSYTINVNASAQTIWGVGFEIQSDSIGSGNNGLPDSNSSVPWELTPSERTRFATEMLAGFRFCRLGLGLYFRGLTPDNRSIVERWPGQAATLAQMAQESGIEGFTAEYWSPAPGWKTSGKFIGGSLLDPLNATWAGEFCDAAVGDLRYIASQGMKPVMWGLQVRQGGASQYHCITHPPIPPLHPQNEPPYSTSYSCCVYNDQQYTATFAACAPRIHAAFPGELRGCPRPTQAEKHEKHRFSRPWPRHLRARLL